MIDAGYIEEAEVVTVDTSQAAWAAGVTFLVQGNHNCLLRITADMSVPDVTVRLAGRTLILGGLVTDGSDLQCLRRFSPANSPHVFVVTATTPTAGAISLTCATSNP